MMNTDDVPNESLDMAYTSVFSRMPQAVAPSSFEESVMLRAMLQSQGTSNSRLPQAQAPASFEETVLSKVSALPQSNGANSAPASISWLPIAAAITAMAVISYVAYLYYDTPSTSANAESSQPVSAPIQAPVIAIPPATTNQVQPQHSAQQPSSSKRMIQQTPHNDVSSKKVEGKKETKGQETTVQKNSSPKVSPGGALTKERLEEE